MTQTSLDYNPSDRRKALEKLLSKPWYNQLKGLFAEDAYMSKLAKIIGAKRRVLKVYPESDNIFRAFEMTPYDQVRVVVIGQDPYHTGCADGLAFSSNSDLVLPPSLEHIYRALEKQEYGGLNLNLYTSTSLAHWAAQGMLMLNMALTVEAGNPGAHKELWKPFTKEVIKRLNEHPRDLIFLLWGSMAQKVEGLITDKRHTILKAEHPAAAAYRSGEWESRDCFLQVNRLLRERGEDEIVWAFDDWLPF